MTAVMVEGSTEGLGHSNGFAEFHKENAVGGIHSKKPKESERRRRRRKQKKAKRASQVAATNGASAAADEDSEDADDAKENTDPQQVVDTLVEVEYVPEKAEIEDYLLEDFKKVFEKFTFNDAAVGAEGNDKKDETAANAAFDKKAASDSDEEEQDVQPKEKGVSNKKKKLQRRMKIAELKQICPRPDVVEIWDVTAEDPKLLVYLKSYRNTVPVPRHWSQKRKFLQGTGYNNHGGTTCRLQGPLESFYFKILLGWVGLYLVVYHALLLQSSSL